MLSSINGMSVIPFKKFGMVRVKEQMNGEFGLVLMYCTLGIWLIRASAKRDCLPCFICL